MVDSEIAQCWKTKIHHHPHQKRRISCKQKVPGGLQPSHKQNASRVSHEYYGAGGIQDEENLQKGRSKEAMEPELSSESSGEMPRTKVVVRRLPPSLSERAFTESVPSHIRDCFNWISFSPGKPSKKRSTSRAYIDFKHPEDVYNFFGVFDGHLFVNERGKPYKASVEYAPHQKVPKQSLKGDAEEGLISEDPEYLEFLEASSRPVKSLPSAEVQIERKEAEKRSRLGGTGANSTIVVTALMDYVRRRRAHSTQNMYMTSKKKTPCRGSSPFANSIVSSLRGSTMLSGNVKCPIMAVKPIPVPCHLLEANQCKDVSTDAKRKAGFEGGGKIVAHQKSYADIVKSNQKLGANRHSGSCRQTKKDLQCADAGKKCKQSSAARIHEKQVWVAKSASGKGT